MTTRQEKINAAWNAFVKVRDTEEDARDKIIAMANEVRNNAIAQARENCEMAVVPFLEVYYKTKKEAKDD